MTPYRTARDLLPDAVALLAPLGVAGIGGAVTVRAIPTWYRRLRKPPWTPPDGAFGPVWSALYLLMGIALVLARRASPPSDRAPVEAVFGVQLALNLAWSLVFFGRRDIAGGLVVIVLLWASIVTTIATFSRRRRLAAALLLPYLAWVTYAVVLNAEIRRLNET